jgi:4-hydroxy-tetrahydrodipicolinate reductase
MKVLQIGLGPIGIAISRLLMRKPGWEIVAAVDTDVVKQGRDLGEVIGLENPVGIDICSEIPIFGSEDVDLAFLTTVSTFNEVLPTLHTLARAGIDVIASTEELFYPHHRYPQQTHDLDTMAKQHGVSILGTGINPGFIMDTLALLLTGVCQDVARIAVTRVVNAAGRRPSLQKQIGVGMSPESFAQAAEQQHVGLVGPTASLAFLADVLQWNMDGFKERLVPVLTHKPLQAAHGQIEVGQVCGVRHLIKGISNGKEVISFDLRVYLGAEQTRDTIYIEGTPTLEATLKSPDLEDVAAAGLLVNMGPLVQQGRPGLLTMIDLPLPHYQR